jgi:hypothetical protein
MHKDKLLQQIRIDRRQLERYLFYFEKDEQGAFVPSSRLKFSLEKFQQIGATAELSVKDIISLLSGWESYFVEWYQHVKFGKPLLEFPLGLTWTDKEQIDQFILTKWENLSPTDALEIFRTSYRQINQTIETIPEDELISAKYNAETGQQRLIDFLNAVTWEHYRWAKGLIHKWSRRGGQRGRDKEGILDHIQSERRRLEKNLSDLSDQEMLETGVVGDWSVKDLLAHLVDWEQRFLDWYQAGLRGDVIQIPAPGISWRELNKLNQLIFEAHKDQPLDEIKADFHASYQQILQTVQAIPEEDFFTVGRFAWTRESNLAAYILANTANHYRWAKDQIRAWVNPKGNPINGVYSNQR